MRGSRARKRRTVVVDYGRGSIKIALAESAQEAVRFHGIKEIPVPRGSASSDDSAAFAAELLEAEIGRRGWRGMRGACLLSGAATSTQSFIFPPMPREDLRRAIELKLDDTLHFDVAGSSFDFRRMAERLGAEDGPGLTLVAAARMEAIREGVGALRAAGLRPVAVGAAAESLANLSQCTSLWDSEEASIHVDMGTHSAILNLFEGRRLRLSREIETAGEAFTAALMRPILTEGGPVHLSYAEAEEVKEAAGYPRDGDERALPHGVRSSEILPLMEPVAQRIVAEIERSIGYLCSLLGRSRIDGIVLSGPAGRMKNLDRFLHESLGTSVVYSDPVERAMAHWRLAVSDENPPDLASFSAILGYSLGHHEPINLLPPEERNLQVRERVTAVRKAAAPIVAAAGVCLAVAGVPIQRAYGDASDVLQWSETQINSRIEQQAKVLDDQRLAADALSAVRIARGAVPDWLGIMKELSVILPDGAWITQLDIESTSAGPEVRLLASIHATSEEFHEVSSAMTMALAGSPYFEEVNVVEAALENEGSTGSFEATLRLVAALDMAEGGGS